MIPLRDVIPSRTKPYVAVTIIVLNAIAWVYELTLSRDALLPFIQRFAVIPNDFDARAVVTAMFLHAGWTHLIGNMWCLWIFGDNVEDRLGRGRFLVFYLLCGLAACQSHNAILRSTSEEQAFFQHYTNKPFYTAMVLRPYDYGDTYLIDLTGEIAEAPSETPRASVTVPLGAPVLITGLDEQHVLARIDGYRTVDAIIQLSPMRDIEALEILKSFQARGLIRV